MSDNLVKRLRDWEHVYPEDYNKDVGHLYEEAADRIESLEEHFKKAMGWLDERYSVVVAENAELKAKLANAEGEE